MVAARVFLAPLLATMPRHEGGMPWAEMLLLVIGLDLFQPY
jgi:hypothetical protein